MTNRHQKHPSFSVFLLSSLLLVFTACDKDDDEPNDNKTQVEFNPDLTYGTMVDQEGNEYKTIKIGEQTWMAENLRTTIFRNGEEIPELLLGTDWITTTESAHCVYRNTTTTTAIATYGRLYNWYTIIDSRNVAPEGWRVPYDNDWLELRNYLISNGYNYDDSTEDDKIAKSLASTNLWNESENEGAVGDSDYPSKQNLSGFSAAPGGLRFGQDYRKLGGTAYWWTLQNEGQQSPSALTLDSDKRYFKYVVHHANRGLSIRCIKNDSQY